jgi:hypothetical protein
LLGVASAGKGAGTGAEARGEVAERTRECAVVQEAAVEEVYSGKMLGICLA